LSFVQRHGLWSDEQREAATRLRRTVEDERLEVIRLSFPDQHGILRGKTLVASEALASLESGCTITTTMLAKDTSHRIVSGVHRGRRFRDAGNGRRRRCSDGA
jgi:glutamine synthetase